MKTIFTRTVAFLLCMAAASLLPACSDDNPVNKDIEHVPDNKPDENTEEEPNKPEEKPDGQDNGFSFIPKEVLAKINAVYSQYNTKPQKVTTVNHLAVLTSICATPKGDGPISVTRALLNDEEVTLVTLGGTEKVEGQATTLKESQLSVFGKPNDYLTAVVKVFNDGKISPEKPVVITGISLGGMIAQQLLSQQKILEKFKIRAIITFGSPLTVPLDRQGIKVVRFADEHDQVPNLGEMPLRTGMVKCGDMSRKELKQKLEELDAAERIGRESKYTGMLESHALSYIEDACWNATDFLGDKDKKNVLELLEDMTFYPAPKLNKE